MKANIDMYKFVIPLSDTQWGVLREIDMDVICGEYKLYNKLIKDMEDMEAECVEFNAHFGQNFFFTAETKDIADKVVVYLENLLGKD